MSIDSMMDTLRALELEMEEADKEYRAKTAAVIETRLVIAMARYSIAMNDIVIGGDGKEYKVIEISGGPNKPWLTGVGRKKDGTWGSRGVPLFSSWRKKEE